MIRRPLSQVVRAKATPSLRSRRSLRSLTESLEALEALQVFLSKGLGGPGEGRGPGTCPNPPNPLPPKSEPMHAFCAFGGVSRMT